MSGSEYFEASPKKGRGRAKAAIEMMHVMRDIAEPIQPVTGRGIGYKLFSRQLISSMSNKNETNRVYRLLLAARKEGIVPWEWIVDETCELEVVPSWDNPADFADCVARQYRKDFWQQQPVRCEVWSEKGTVRGVVAPTLNKYGVGFRVTHGFAHTNTIRDAALYNDGRPLVVLYLGDFDPSGMYMSQQLQERLADFGGDHVIVKRIAINRDQTTGLIPFPASDKIKDSRHKWFVNNHGDECWELDAMDPNELRACVEREILELIEPEAWNRCVVVNRAERESLNAVVGEWKRLSSTA